MKKTVFLLNFIIMSVGVSGMNHNRAVRNGAASSITLKSIEKNDWGPELFAPSQQRNVRSVPSSSHSRQRSEPKDQERKKKQKKSQKGKEPACDISTPKELDPETEEKINNFAHSLKIKNIKNKRRISSNLVKKVLTEYSTNPNVSIDKIAKKYGIMESTLFSWKTKAGLSFRRKVPNQAGIYAPERIVLDLDVKEKIHNFAQNRQHRFYSAKQIEEALIDWFTKGRNESNKVSYRSLQEWSRLLGITSSRGDISRRVQETKQKLINNLDQGADWNSFHNNLGKKQRHARQMLGQLQDSGLVEISLTEEEKDDLLYDYRKGLLTKKGLAKKYNIKESDVFCILHEARKNGKDMSRINITSSQKYSRRNPIPKRIREKLVNDYNKELLTVRGISVKYHISLGMVQKILFKENNEKVERRNGKRTKDDILVDDLQNKSNQEIEKKYGYKSAYIDDLKRYITHWKYLTDDQKNLFKTTMESKTMPSNYVLSSIKRSSVDGIDEKFKKLLFILISTKKEIIKKYDLTVGSANRLRRGVNLWKVLAKEL